MAGFYKNVIFQKRSVYTPEAQPYNPPALRDTGPETRPQPLANRLKTKRNLSFQKVEIGVLTGRWVGSITPQR